MAHSAPSTRPRSDVAPELAATSSLAVKQRSASAREAILRSIDLNADLGERFGVWRMGDDDRLGGVAADAGMREQLSPMRQVS